MKHSVVLKFIAVVLAACGLTAAIGSAFGMAVLAQSDLYAKDYETWQDSVYREKARSLATALAESYAARNLSGFTEDELQYIDWGNSWQTIGMWQNMDSAGWSYTIASSGSVQESTYNKKFDGSKKFVFTQSVNYPISVSAGMSTYAEYYMETPEGQPKYLHVADAVSPVYTVTVWFAPDSIFEYNGISMDIYGVLLRLRYYLIAGLGAGLLLVAACLVYLCCVAGKKRSGVAPQPGGLNRLPLDAYGAVVAVACYCLSFITVEVTEEFIYYSTGINWGWFTLGVLAVFAASLCVVGFLMALAAQWKMGLRWLWAHTLIGWCCGKLWLGFRYSCKILCKLLDLLPMIWRYLLIAVVMGALPMFCAFGCIVTYGVFRAFWMLLLFGSLGIDFLIILYGGYAYGTVLKGARKMAEGDLYTKIDTRFLVGSYGSAAKDLNALADVAEVAARNQLKSDRMKTELITNVTHDIKTPLTSIINYIDLLQKAENQEQTVQYLQVLDRQSQRLKRLIEDLMEMSKATTGDMAVDPVQMDPAEAVNQALGEFADKLAQCDLAVVFRQPEKPMAIRADGRLTWRVLSNLLSNVVKYALPGTRVYVDMKQLEGRVAISIKNISREPLNVSADELTERFVRGDASRNTEGSGLGLNIAKSLMELQKGQLELLVDGDLFKVTLIFPAM